MAHQFRRGLSVLEELGWVDVLLEWRCFSACEPVTEISRARITALNIAYN